MAMRCPCTDHLHYISSYISPSRQQKSILQLCRSGYSHAFLPPKSCPWPSSTMCQTTESSNVRASFNLVKVSCFFFLELVLVQASVKRKDKHTPWTSLQLLWDNDDVLMLMCTRAKSVASLQPVWDEVQMRKPLLVSTEPWPPPLGLYQRHACTCTCICIWAQNRGHLHLPVVPTAYRMIASWNLLHA